jgi:hypothetical protein
MNGKICYADLKGSPWAGAEKKSGIDPADWLMRRRKIRRRLNQVWDALARERQAGPKARS